MTNNDINPTALPIRVLMALLLTLGLAVGCEDDPEPTPEGCGGELGEAGCACLADGSCGDGLVCSNNLCEAESVSGVEVSAPAARGCEVLLETSGGDVQDVRYSAALRGTFIQESPRVALSFVSLEDTPIETGAIEIASPSGVSLSVLSSSCVDVSGVAIADAEVTLP